VGPDTNEKETIMIHLDSNRIDATKQQPGGNADLNEYLIDDEFDDFLDRELLALSETFADFRNC
jgi:hypothetical protein